MRSVVVMTHDYVKEAIDAAQPALFARDYETASAAIRNALHDALAENRRDDAATLSSILATYLSLGGDYDAAYTAYRQAADLQPDEPDHELAIGRHLFFQMNRFDEARSKVEQVLEAQTSDPVVRHKSAALLGRFAIAEDSLNRAAAHLDHAREIAASADIPPPRWDLELVKRLVSAGADQEGCRRYLEDLRVRARAGGDRRVVEEVSRIAGGLDSG